MSTAAEAASVPALISLLVILPVGRDTGLKALRDTEAGLLIATVRSA